MTTPIGRGSEGAAGRVCVDARSEISAMPSASKDGMAAINNTDLEQPLLESAADAPAVVIMKRKS